MANSRDVQLPGLEEFKTSSLRGAADFFRVGQTRNGQWWLVDPHGRAFFSKGVAAVNRGGRAVWPVNSPGHYAAAVWRIHGGDDPQPFVRSVIQRMRSWHLNSLGAWTDPAFFDDGMYYTETLDFRKTGPAIHFGDALLPDVFDPAWREAVDVLARERCAARRDSRELIGYFTDYELNWAQPSSEKTAVKTDPAAVAPVERPSLLQLCLSLEPSFRAYHAAWEFVLAPRAGEMERLARDWKVDLPNKETLRQLTQAETPLLSEGYLRDQKRFTREFARRYFSICAEAIRAHDRNHLILGCRFARHPGGSVLAECVYPHVDVLSAHPAGETPDKIAQSYQVAGTMPLLLTEVSWASDLFTKPPARRETRRMTSLERMLARGRSVFERIFAQRNVVGYEWARWADAEDDTPPFGQGLVRIDDREACEHTELLTDLNMRAEHLRMRAR